MNVTRNIILTADGSKALSTINQVDGKISAMSSASGSIGKLAGVLKFAGVAAAVTAVFGTITKNVLKFSGQLQQVESQLKVLFKDKNAVLSATNELMASYDYTKIQTQKYLSDMAARISDVVSEKNLAKASTGAIRVAQRISTVYGVSLEHAMEVVGRAMHGHTQGLERYGIAIDKNVKGSLRILGSMEEATAKYEEVIEEQKNTIRWQLDNMKNAVKSAWMKVAKQFDDILGPVLRKINNLIGQLKISSGIEGSMKAIQNFFAAFTASLDKCKPALQALTDALSMLNKALLRPIADFAAKAESVDGAISAINNIIQSLNTVVLLIGDIVGLWVKLNFGVSGLIGPMTTIKWALRIVNAALIPIRLMVSAISAVISFIIDVFNGLLSALRSLNIKKFKEGWKTAVDNFTKANDEANAYLDKQLDLLATDMTDLFIDKVNKMEVKVNESKVPKSIEVQAPSIDTAPVHKAVQQGVNQLFDNITVPVEKVQQAVKVANELNLEPMTQQIEAANKSIIIFTNSLKNLDITKTIVESFSKLKANIETALNDIGSVNILQEAGETFSTAVTSFAAAVNSFNSDPKNEELISQAKQTNVYLERISRNLVGVDVFA